MRRILAVILLSLVVLFYSLPTPGAVAAQEPARAMPPMVAAQAVTPVAVATATRAPIRMFVSAVPAANVRSGPSESFPILTTLPTGTEVQVYEVSGEWRRIRCSQLSDYAWIHGSLISEMASPKPVPTNARSPSPTNARGPLSTNTPEGAETAAILALLGLGGLLAVLFVLTSFVFPIWAASYASGRGHSGWAAVAVLSIFVGCGSIGGLFAWLGSRGILVVHMSPTERRYVAPEASDDHDPDPRWEAQQEREREKERERQEELEEREELREAEKEAEREEWNEHYEQKEQERIDRLYEEREERYERLYQEREEKYQRLYEDSDE